MNIVALINGVELAIDMMQTGSAIGINGCLIEYKSRFTIKAKTPTRVLKLSIDKIDERRKHLKDLDDSIIKRLKYIDSLEELPNMDYLIAKKKKLILTGIAKFRSVIRKVMTLNKIDFE